MNEIPVWITKGSSSDLMRFGPHAVRVWFQEPWFHPKYHFEHDGPMTYGHQWINRKHQHLKASILASELSNELREQVWKIVVESENDFSLFQDWDTLTSRIHWTTWCVKGFLRYETVFMGLNDGLMGIFGKNQNLWITKPDDYELRMRGGRGVLIWFNQPNLHIRTYDIASTLSIKIRKKKRSRVLRKDLHVEIAWESSCQQINYNDTPFLIRDSISLKALGYEHPLAVLIWEEVAKTVHKDLFEPEMERDDITKITKNSYSIIKPEHFLYPLQLQNVQFVLADAPE